MSKTLEAIAGLSPEKKRALLEQILREKTARSAAIPLSFAQQRLWFLDRLEPGAATYNVPTLLRLKGPVDRDRLASGLNKIVERHEALRTTFQSIGDDHPVQRIDPARPVDFQYRDLSGKDGAEAERAAFAIFHEESRRPFDLANDLMIRGTLVRLSAGEHLLLLVTHHIASDEWSLQLLLKEWRALYEDTQPLPALPIQYADFSQWQRDWVKSAEYEAQLAYWKTQLAAPMPVVTLPADRPRPDSQAHRGALHEIHFPAALTGTLKELARRQEATLFMVLLAGFKALLHRYTLLEDVVVGSPIAGRNRMEVEQLIGFFVNTLPLRTKLKGTDSFLELLQQVKTTTLGAYAHQDVPFDKLVETLQPERSATHMPLVQVMFTLNNDIVQGEVFPGVHGSFMEIDTGTAKFDLTCVARETPDGLAVVFEYDTALFNRERIEQFAGHFLTLLQGIAREPAARIQALRILTEEEERRITKSWNETASDYPSEQCVHELFERQAAQTPEAIAAEYNGEQISYRELDARANQIAHRLQSLTRGPHPLVGVYMDRGIEMLTALLGILKAGGAYVPLDLSYPKERLAFMIEDCAMPVLLTQAAHAQDLPANAAAVLCLDSERGQIDRESRERPQTQTSPDSIAYVIYTSGSTGQPKGVAVPHRGISRLVLATNYIHLRAGDRVAQASNASFDAATFEIWGPLLNGGTVVGVSKETSLSPQEFAAQLRSRQINTLFLTTALFNQLAREVPGAFATLDSVLFGGEAVDPKWVRAVLECSPPRRLLHVYGPTESTTFTSYYLVKSVPETAATVPIGKPISNTSIYILDEARNAVPAGVPGEVYVGGDGLAREYLNRPELTAERFVPHPFSAGERLYRTGDLARFDSEGNVEFIGRVDHQVKIRGFRIELGEIENLLAKHPGISNAVILVREDVPGDKRLVAYLIPNGPAPSTAELRAHLRTQLPDYMVPGAYVFMDAFPLTPNEKIDRKALPAPDQNRPELSKTFIAPRDSTEQQLAKVWEKVLGVQPIGVADNFFELGGHSLLAVRLFSQIEKVFSKKLPLATLFRAPTIEQIARILRDDNQTKAWSTIVDIQPRGSRLPMFWIHSLGGDGGGGFFYYRKLSELLGPDQPAFGIRSPQQPFSNIPEMAAFYVSELRRFQPEGPYFLGGFCFGGIVAYEMARQLTEAGEEIGVLALMESSAPNVHPKHSGWKASDALHSLENLVENVKDFVNHTPQEKLAFMREKSQRLRKKLQGKIAAVETSAGTAPRIELKDMIDLANYPKDYVKYAETHWQALTEFHPEPYSGTIHLFRARKQGLTNFDHTLNWDVLAGDRVDVNVIPGDHESMLQEPNVQILAEKLRSLLEHAQKRTTEPEEFAVH